MLEEYLVQTCYVITMGRNEYSDYTEISRVAEACRFREITTVRRAPQQEILDSDALLHLAPTTAVVKGSIINFEGTYYQVERITFARRLGETEVQFVKADLKVTDVNIS